MVGRWSEVSHEMKWMSKDPLMDHLSYIIKHKGRNKKGRDKVIITHLHTNDASQCKVLKETPWQCVKRQYNIFLYNVAFKHSGDSISTSKLKNSIKELKWSFSACNCTFLCGLRFQRSHETFHLPLMFVIENKGVWLAEEWPTVQLTELKFRGSRPTLLSESSKAKQSYSHFKLECLLSHP